jgi:NADPH-dependent 2,4-dienoyl-CoA reductase/sulfur reductase-like enzyme
MKHVGVPMVERFSYVIVGNGIAGVTAAETLRVEDSLADITVIADNSFPVYNRPALKDFLAGRVSEDKLWMRPKSFYQDHQIRFFMERVVGIHAGRHSVQLQSGRQVGYNRLLLATGARARRLSCPGANLAGVSTLHAVADYQKVLNRLGYVRRIVVIGSGPLALETVEILHHRGYQVTHLLRHRTLWSEVLDKTASDLVLQQEWRDGVDVGIEEEIAEIVGRNGQVTGVVTTSGAHIPCEMVIVAIGIEPVLEYINESGIDCGRGVRVDGCMRTSARDIYAAGDVAEVTGAVTGRTRIIGQWYPAIQQGRAAAYSMLDMLDTSRLPHPCMGSGAYLNSVTTMFLYGLDFAAVGLTNMPEESQGYQEIVADPNPYVYRKALLKDGIPVGMLSLGERKDALVFKRAIDHTVNLLPIASRLFAGDFKLADWLDQQKVPIPVLAVSKVRNAARTKPLALIPIQATTLTNAPKRQIIQVRPGKEQSDEQEERNTLAASASVDPYTIPIVSVPKAATAALTASPSEAFLVPVFPTNIVGGERAGKETSPEYIAPRWAETQLSPTRVLTIGRQPNASLLINHHAVSRCHAEITYADGHYLLRDLGSKNGTFLNDERVEPRSVHILNAHDQIRIGTVMVYSLQVRPINQTEEALPHPKNG